jgi:hypothetical protein
MSFDLAVYVPIFPLGLKGRWEQRLALEGLRCAFPPGFNPARWPGGYVPVKVEEVAHYGSIPVLASFEFDVGPSDGTTEGQDVPGPLGEILTLTRWRCWLVTKTGRSAADLRVQSFAAATLAEVAGGVVFDPQQGRYFAGREAITNAAAESASYERWLGDPSGWALEPWPGWEALGCSPAE